MITFLGPHLPPQPRHAGLQPVRALENLIQTAYSRLPEHAAARAHVLALNHLSLRIADGLSVALPQPWHEFWQAYAGWFAMYSVAPLLANALVARQVVAGSDDDQALIIENWRSRGWWSGRESLEAAIRDHLEAAELTVRVRPDARLQVFRRLLAARMARSYGEAELRKMAQSITGLALTDRPRRSDVLWLTVGASAVDLVARVQPVLPQHGLTSDILDFDYFGSREALERTGADQQHVGDFLTRGDMRQGWRWCREARAMWPEVSRDLHTVAWPDDVTARQREAIADRLRLVLWRDGAAWRMRSLAVHRALETLNPRVVVGFHVYGPPVAPVVVAARERSIARVCLQHGVIGPRYLALPCLPYDEKLVFGEYARETMARACPQMRVTVTGHALYDTRRQTVTPRPEVRALRESVPWLVVLCTQFNEHVYYRKQQWWMRGVAEACRTLGARLAIKLHPSDSPSNVKLYQTLLRPNGDSVVLIPHGTYPLDEVLAVCDLMVTRDSTVVFEANLLDKPAITVNLSDVDEELPYAATGGALGVYQYDRIAPAITSVLRDETVRQDLAAHRAEFLAQHVGPNDGRATERIAEIIAQWAEGRRRRE